jgi:hypothetical protein
MKAYVGSKYTAPLILNLSTTLKRVVNLVARALYREGNGPSTHRIHSLVVPRVGLNVLQNK